MAKTTFRVFQLCALAALLSILPIGLDSDGGSFPQAKAAAGGNGKGNGKCRRATSRGGNSQAGANSQGQGNMKGAGEVNIANNQSKSKDELGRLNAFLHASPKALQHASPNSAIGIIAVQYRDVISAYLDGTAQGQQPAPTLDAAAAVLAQAANKPLSPEIVAAINMRLAAENPDNLSLASFANVNADPIVEAANTQLASDLSTLANETNQGFHLLTLGTDPTDPPFENFSRAGLEIAPSLGLEFLTPLLRGF